MELILALLSFNVPGILVTLGGVLLFSLFFEQIFGNKLLPGAQRRASITGIVLCLIGIGLMIAGVFIKPSTTTATNLESPTPSTDSSLVDADLKSSSFYSFYGITDPKFGNGVGRVFALRSTASDFDYKLEYDIPNQGNGYAGFVFAFKPELNITIYKYVEITLSLGDPGANCDVYLKRGMKANYIRICDGSFEGAIQKEQIESTRNGSRLTVRIPLVNEFKDVDPRQVEEIGFSANSDFSRGSHSFTIHNIRLIK